MSVGTFPRFRLFDETGVSLIFEFDFVTAIDDNQDPANSVEHQTLRGQGSIIIPGSDSAWDLPIEFILRGTDYEDLTAQIDTLKSSVLKFTKYILKIDKTTGGATQDYKVIRRQTFRFPTPATGRKRITIQRVDSVFRVDSWK